MTTQTLPKAPLSGLATPRSAAVRALWWQELRENRWLLVGILALGAAMVGIVWSPARFRFILPPPETAPFASLAATPNLVWQAMQFLLNVAVVAAPALAFSRPRQRGTMGRLLALPLTRGQLFLGKLLGAATVSLVAVLAASLITVSLARTGEFGVPTGSGLWFIALNFAVQQATTVVLSFLAGLLFGNMLIATLASVGAVWCLSYGVVAAHNAIVMRYWLSGQVPAFWLGNGVVLLGYAVPAGVALALAYRLTRRLEPRPAPIDVKRGLRVLAVVALVAAVGGGAWIWRHQAALPPGERATLVYELTGAEAPSPKLVDRTAEALSARLRAMDAFISVRTDAEAGRITADIRYRNSEDLAQIQKALAVPGHVSFHAVAGKWGTVRRQRGDEDIEFRIREILARKAAGTYRREDEAYDVAIYRSAGEGKQPEEFPVLLRNDGAVDGSEVLQASVETRRRWEQGRERDMEYVVSFTLTPLGRSQLGVLTQEHVNEQMAIFLDGRILSAPTVRSAITGGRGIIEGDFTEAEAKRIAALLSSGPLPAPIRLVSQTPAGR